MVDKFYDFWLGVNQNRLYHGRRNNMVMLAALQLIGGWVLYETDYARGVPLIIQNSGIITMPVFAALMFAAGIVHALAIVFFLHTLNTWRVLLFLAPFIVYMCFSTHGVVTGQIPAQTTVIIFLLFLIVMNGIWSTDRIETRR